VVKAGGIRRIRGEKGKEGNGGGKRWREKEEGETRNMMRVTNPSVEIGREEAEVFLIVISLRM